MNTFGILLTLAYQIIPIVLFVWLILYLAKKNSSSKNVTPTIENTSPKQNRLKKIILIIVFLMFALPGLFVWLVLIWMMCDAPDACKNGLPLIFWILAGIPIIIIGGVIKYIVSQ